MSSQNEQNYDFPLIPRQSFIFEDLNNILFDIINLLNTPSSQRSPLSLKKLQNLTCNIPFFKQLIQDYDEKAHFECCMCLKHIHYDKKDIVCRYGDEAEWFYIILQGKVKVFVPDEYGRKLKECTVLMTGCAFGEFALLKNRTRSATIVCLEDSDFAVLGKKDFLKILGAFTSKKFDENARFLKALPLFADWALNSLVQLSYYFRPIRFKRNQKIFLEGEPADFVYIVKNGEVEISKQNLLKSPSETIIGAHGRPLPNFKKPYIQTYNRISIIGPGEIIGDNDALNSNFYTKTCKCYSSQADLFQISSFEFKKRIRSEESLNILAEKNTFRNNHQNFAMRIIQQVQLPMRKIPKIKALSNKKLASEIKAIWHSSIKTIHRPGLNNSHRSSVSVITSPFYRDLSNHKSSESKIL
ncbi:hypothetical protein SteCoe_18245 [Stentor coeruleus]|uniref:Cyclic nucleotide-binding domain-containing protein n=1 Tax=Stentor coeruleus TaxID=5963 RepID=A0A1R2BWZ6_9CILI|nr:hypothetical protein SteCoe_18245 [Stentor coeruleus]